MIYVFLANGFEEVEALTVVDYLRRCEGLQVKTVGIGEKTNPQTKIVTGAHGVPVLTDISVFDIAKNEIEMIVLPGGMPGTINLEKSPFVLEAIKHCMDENKFIAAICAAPSILGHLGYLKGKDVVCFEGFESELDGANVLDCAVAVSQNIITARGAGVANQFAFALIEALLGKSKADKIKDSILWEK